VGDVDAATKISDWLGTPAPPSSILPRKRGRR
jgi:hypothetical protein